MPIVYLKERITGDEAEFNKYISSADSLLFLRNYDPTKAETFDQSGTDCLSLRVGDKWFDRSRYVQISNKGIKIKPQTSVVVETQEQIALPLNMYGLLFGTGKNIYSGGFISNGKIDPGFCGNLRIGFYNGSRHTVILKTGDKLAYCIFMDMESELVTKPLFTVSSAPAAVKLGRLERLKIWFVENLNLSNFIAIIALIVSLCNINIAIPKLSDIVSFIRGVL